MHSLTAEEIQDMEGTGQVPLATRRPSAAATATGQQTLTLVGSQVAESNTNVVTQDGQVATYVNSLGTAAGDGASSQRQVVIIKSENAQGQMQEQHILLPDGSSGELDVETINKLLSLQVVGDGAQPNQATVATSVEQNPGQQLVGLTTVGNLQIDADTVSPTIRQPATNELTQVTYITEPVTTKAEESILTSPGVSALEQSQNDSGLVQSLGQSEMESYTMNMEPTDGYLCGYCQILYPDLKGIREHMLVVHKEQLPEGGPENVQLALQ